MLSELKTEAKTYQNNSMNFTLGKYIPKIKHLSHTFKYLVQSRTRSRQAHFRVKRTNSRLNSEKME